MEGRTPRQRALLLVALMVASGLLRSRGRGFSLWVDEGITVGIASQRLGEIPAALAQDGSPPLYYLLLHGWIQVFGTSAAALRSLSLVFALAVIPVAYWAGRRLVSERAGWVAAVLAATVPYLSGQSREARMYSLVVLLGLLALSTFLEAFGRGRRRWLPGFVLSLTALLLTHHWGLFLAVGLAVAAGWSVARTEGSRRRPAVDAVAAFGAVALLYSPWVPTLIGQIGETGAPWSRRPGPGDGLYAMVSVLGSWWVVVVLAIVAVVLVRSSHRGDGPGPVPSWVPGLILLILVTTVVASWTASQVAPAWSPRYFGVYLPALLLLAALALARTGRTGVVALGVVVVLWTVPLPLVAGGRTPTVPAPKSNAETLARRLDEVLQPGDVVLSTQMEQVPLLFHYLGPDLRYADPSGVVADPRLVDWRGALDRLRAADPGEVLDPLVAGLEPGGHVAVVCPRLFTDGDDLLWYRLMDRHCDTARRVLAGDPLMARVWGPVPDARSRQVGDALAATVYERTAR